MSGWREAFEERGSSPRTTASASPAWSTDDAELASNMSVYKPWTVQRGGLRPSLMLELRTYEPRSGFWSGWQLSYPTLLAVEYTGDRLLTLDFGLRQYVIEGRGLGELARHLQLGAVISIQEFAPSVWPSMPTDAIVSKIRRVVGGPERTP